MPDPEQITPPPASAANASPAAPAPSLVDQYDAEGEDTSEPAAPASAAVRSPAPEPDARGPERLRNADGTFAAAQPQERKHSQYMIGMATELGIDPTEIATMTPDTLEVAVYHLSKQQRVRQREASVEQTMHQATDRSLGAQAGGGSPAGQTSSPSAQPEAAVPPEDPFDLGIDEQAYDPALIGAIKKMGAAHQKEIKQLKQQIGQLQHMEAIRANETFAQKMDRLFAGDEGTFGKGEGRTLKDDGPELARRRAVLGVMQSIKAGTIEQKYEKAYELLYGTRVEAPAANDALAQRQEEWRRGNVARPTQRSGAAEPPGVEKAKRNVAAKLAEANGAVDSGEADEGDFLG